VSSENPRFVVTSLTVEQWVAQDIYEKFYCAMGEMETRIKDADVPVRRLALYRWTVGNRLLLGPLSN